MTGGGVKNFRTGGGGVKNFRTWGGLPIWRDNFAGGFSIPLHAMVVRDTKCCTGQPFIQFL